MGSTELQCETFYLIVQLSNITNVSLDSISPIVRITETFYRTKFGLLLLESNLQDPAEKNYRIFSVADAGFSSGTRGAQLPKWVC